ncbi:trehalase [Flagelloscypha sp. PMI_526]|nr:trehalase [Flagelloscypha sp. PMI_526]
MWKVLAYFAALSGLATALPQAASSSGVPSITVTTAVAQPSNGDLDAKLPKQVALPPKQDWCPSEIFCAGALLQTVHLATLFADPKTVVDKPTSKPPSVVLADFNNATQGVDPLPVTTVLKFEESDFSGEGQELIPTELEGYKDSPSFLGNVSDPILKGFSQAVHSYWNDLVRTINQTTLCDGSKCESSLIPLNHTFVVPGQRFREQYYWDSFWIVEGLLVSELFSVAKSTLQNFMDEIERFGFIPNGGRIYYLNRSQPPLFIQMLARYVEVSGDKSILDRAVPLAKKELAWWKEHRSINITSPTSNLTHLVYRFNVNNSAPRPESYLQDYNLVNPKGQEVLTEDQRSQLYAELATGAESGWDYSSRWMDGAADLTKLRIRGTIPVDLNAILYRAHVLLADLAGGSDASDLKSAAADLKSGILDLLWNPTKLAFYDFDINRATQNSQLTVASFYPAWAGILPPEVLQSSDKAFGYFSSVNLLLSRFNGTFPPTFLETGQQWDAPSAWPPHQYIVLKALAALPSNVSNSPLPTNASFSLVPTGQLGLEEASLPGQPVAAGKNATKSGAQADVSRSGATFLNGGNATDGEGWAKTLERALANRYTTSAFCSWRATGGSLPDVLPKLSNEELNVTQSINNTGNMFEKFSVTDVNSAGRGGEYTVQAGFGWTNGVLLWVASTYGKELVLPSCPNLLTTKDIESSTSGGGSTKSNAAGALVFSQMGWMVVLGVGLTLIC